MSVWQFGNIHPLVKGTAQPKSFYLTEFNSGAVRAFSKSLNEAIELGQFIYPIHIESPGGDVYAMNAMLGLIESARGKGLKIATITSGFAMSAGANIFCYGCNGLRFAGENATIMIHSAHAELPDLKIGEHKSFSDQAHNEQIRLFEKISKHMGKRKDYIEKSLKKRSDYDWVMSAQEAHSEGIVNVIGFPNFSVDIEVSVNYVI